MNGKEGVSLERRNTGEGDEDLLAKEALTINEDILVTEYAPDVFSFLRMKDGYSNKTLEDSLNPEKNNMLIRVYLITNIEKRGTGA